jgi:hypothetical protein
MFVVALRVLAITAEVIELVASAIVVAAAGRALINSLRKD